MSTSKWGKCKLEIHLFSKVDFTQFCKKKPTKPRYSEVPENFGVSGFKLNFADYLFYFFSVCKVVQRRTKQSVACCSSPLA